MNNEETFRCGVTKLLYRVREKPFRHTPIAHRECRGIVFYDIDDLLVLTTVRPDRARYTGHSHRRWRAFASILHRERYRQGVVTMQDRRYNGRPHAPNTFHGLPDWCPQLIAMHYGEAARVVLGYMPYRQYDDDEMEWDHGISTFVDPELVYFCDHACSKADAAEHALTASRTLGDESKNEVVVALLDDNAENIKKMQARGFRGFLAPTHMYAHINASLLETKCIRYMLQVLSELDIDVLDSKHVDDMRHLMARTHMARTIRMERNQKIAKNISDVVEEKHTPSTVLLEEKPAPSPPTVILDVDSIVIPNNHGSDAAVVKRYQTSIDPLVFHIFIFVIGLVLSFLFA